MTRQLKNVSLKHSVTLRSIGRFGIGSVLAATFLAAPGAFAGQDPIRPASAADGHLSLVRRTLGQDQGDWQVDYSFQNDGSEPLTIAPGDVSVRAEAWLSNSKVESHGTPRHAATFLDGRSGPVAFAELVASTDEESRCRERLTIQVAIQPPAASPPAVDPPMRASMKVFPALTHNQSVPLGTSVVSPGAELLVRLRFEHHHMVQGDYDPLLGRRDIEIKLGASMFRDSLPLDREQYLAMPRDVLPEPPAENKDARYAVSGPDSLHLDAESTNGSYYRFPDHRVRYSTRMKLRFWYRIAEGTEGSLKVKLAQYRYSPSGSYKGLYDANMDIALPTAGRWVLFEKVFRTEAESTNLVVDFRITSCDVGEAWIDDVSLVPLDGSIAGP